VQSWRDGEPGFSLMFLKDLDLANMVAAGTRKCGEVTRLAHMTDQRSTPGSRGRRAVPIELSWFDGRAVTPWSLFGRPPYRIDETLSGTMACRNAARSSRRSWRPTARRLACDIQIF
jgi:hypothetical protein